MLLATSAGLFAIGIIPLILLLFFWPQIFSVVFGSEWRKAGILVQWLASWWFVTFLAGPAFEAVIILQLQKYLLIFQSKA